MQKRPSQPIRYETYCLFCGKTWSVQLGSPQLSCTCGANINCLRDLTTKAAQDLEEKVLGVLMDTWQEKMGEPRKRQLQSPVVPTRTKVVASSAPVIEEPLTPATRKLRLIHAPLSTDTGAEKARKERQGEKAENEENERAATSNATRSVRKRTAPRCNMNLLASQDDFKSVLAFHKTMQDTAAVEEPPPTSSLALDGGASTSSTGWMKDLHRLQHQLEQMTHNKEQHMQQWQLEREILRSAAAMEGTRNVPSRDTYRKKQGRRYDTERGDGTRRTKVDEEEEEEEEELYRRMKRRRRGRRRRL